MVLRIHHHPCPGKTTMNPTRKLFAITTLLYFAWVVAATASEWTVIKVSQPTFYSHAGGEWKQIVNGMRLPNNTWINTKRRGRVKLRRGGDVILVNPNSLTGITGSQSAYGRIRVRHERGRIDLAIKKGRMNRVFVDTKLLAAVVKGTQFSVTSDGRTSTVSVARGLVGVVDNASGQRADVGTGQNVSSSADRSGFSSTTGVTSSTASISGVSSTSGYRGNTDNGQGNNGNGNGNGGGNGQGNNGNGNGNGGGNGQGNNGNGNGGGNGQGNFGNGNGNGGANRQGNNGNGNGGK